MIDYKGIIDNLDTEAIIELMKKLGVSQYIEKPDCIIFNTICHNEDAEEAKMKLYFYKRNKHFYCYTQCGGMTIFKFLEHYYETRGIIYDWYEDIYRVAEKCSKHDLSLDFSRAPQYKKKGEKYKKIRIEPLKIYNNNILDVFVKEYPIEWLNDGISKEAMDKFNIHYSITENKIIIPHYNIDGQLIGIRGRALNEEEAILYGKYMPVKIENKWYSHKLSLNLYGLELTKDNIRENGICYLFESEKSVMQLESMNNFINCGAAVCGSNFNKYQLKILLKECKPKEIVICFDKEELPGEEKYFNKLMTLCKKYSIYCNFSFVYDRENLLELKDSPTDKGEDIFRQLLKKRVKVK